MATKLMKVGQYIYDEPASYDDFSGGINTDSSNENLLNNQLRDALNMRYDNLGLRKRFGATKHADIVFSKDLTNIQGIFLFTQVNPWLIVASNGRLYYGLYNAGGTIDLNELPIKSKIELANPSSINIAYQLYNLPIKTTELGTEIHDGYFYKPQTFTDGELIFQNKRNIEGVPHRDKFYIATGTRIVEVSIENEKPEAYLIDPYKPNGIELVQIGPNFLSPFPNLALNEKAESVKTAIHGVIPIGMNDGSVKLQAIMSYEQGKSAKDYRFKWEKIVDNDAIPVKFNDTYDLIFNSELDTKGIPISQGKDSIIITADEAQSFYYRVTFAREFERVDETVETSALKLETIAIPNGSYQDYIINQLIDWFGSATSILYTDELKEPSLEWAKINSCVKVTGDGNKLLFYDDNYNSGNWYKTIINNPRYITNRGGLNFKTTLNEQLIKVIDFKGIIVCFSYNPYLGGNISIVIGDGDDYNDGSGQFSPYARRVVNKQISTDNPSTVHIAENIIIFKYKDMVYMIEGSQLSNEIVSVQSINDHVRTPSAYVNIPWEDNNCIAELTEDHYALIWKEKTKYVDGQMVIERPAQRIKMYYKLAFQHGGRIIFPWLRDEGSTFNVDHIIQIGNRSYHLYDNLLIGYHEKKFTDLGEKYPVRLFLRGYDLNYGQYIKMLHKLSLYYSRGDKRDIDIKVNAYNEANYKILKDPTVTHTQQNLAVQYYDDTTGYKKVDNTLLDVKLFTASRRFPALFAHVTIEVENDDDFAFMSIGFIYKTRDLPKTTLFEYYKNIWTDVDSPMTIMEDYKPLKIQSGPQPQAGSNTDLNYYAKLLDSFKKDFISKTDVMKLYQLARDFIEYETEEDFPFEGEEGRIYLAKYKNAALEGEDPVLEDYNMMFRWNKELSAFIPVAGQGSGGGGGTGTVTRVIPFPVGTPTVFGHRLGSELVLGFNYINTVYENATRILYVNDIAKNTAQINTGENTVDVTPFLSLGLNTIKIYVTDPEGVASQLIYRVSANSVSLSSTFNDSVAIQETNVFIPYAILGTAQVKTMHFILDGVETTEVVTNNNGAKTLSGLSHGLHELEMYVVGDFQDANGNTLYSITSNSVYLNIIYVEAGNTTTIVSSKFRLAEEQQGNTVTVDYIVYNSVSELSPVSLYIDDVLQTNLSVDDTKQFWNIKTLTPGLRTLRIQSGDVFVTKTITILPIELDIEVIKDSFLKLFMTAFGKTNNDLDREEWLNSYGDPVGITFENVNFSNTGWVGDALRLLGDAKTIINYKPFAANLPSSGKTMEFDFTTRFTVSENTRLLSCFSGGVGFEISTQGITLYGSNVKVESRFKEDEHVKVAFVITPAPQRLILTYINGVISGIANYTAETSFRQLTPVNITVNPEGGSIDLFSIRVYDRALNEKEMLENFLSEVNPISKRVEKYMFNDVYDSYGNPSKEKMGERIPIMMIEGSPLPEGKIRPRPYVNVYFEHPFDPTKNFERTGLNTDIDAQGTSSLQYPIKNFKIRLDQKKSKELRVPYQMEPWMIPERVFTLKADYMDSSHSHNTGLAKLFDTMYSEPIPPKAFNEAVRTAVYGYPCALFHRLTSSDPWVYKGIYNFNHDKDATDTMGLNDEMEYQEGNPLSVFPNVKSYEIAFNADASAGAFKDYDLGGTLLSFEPRFPESDEYDFFADNNVLPISVLNYAKGILKTYTTDPGLIAEIENANYDDIIEIFDTNFASTPETTPDPEYVVGGVKVINLFRKLQEQYEPIRNAIKFVVDNNDTVTFKDDFENYFHLEYHLKYLIATLVFGLVDNLGKNAMFNTWDGNVFYPNFYDIDTAMGVENQGKLVHNYDIEIGDVDAYATADSLLWKNMLKYFKTELDTTYGELRQNIFSYENILNFLNEQQISKISESQYNLDTFAKYIGVTLQWLYMAQGDTLEHKKRWLTLRLAFLDSKFLYTEYKDSTIAIRISIPSVIEDPEIYNIWLDYTVSQYAGAQFGGALGNIVFQEKVLKNKISKFVQTEAELLALTNELNGTVVRVESTNTSYKLNNKPTPETLNWGSSLEHWTVLVESATIYIPVESFSGLTNMEVSIFGAKWIRAMGSIAHLYPISVGTENATRLEELIIGSEEEGYSNDKLVQVSVGANSYLKKIFLTNCVSLGNGLTQVLDLSLAENIREVHALGTQLKGVTFPIGANLEILKLPASITQLILRNMPLLREENVTIEGYDNITTLRIENMNDINSIQIANLAASLQRIRLLGLTYSMYGIDSIIALSEKIYDDELEEYRILGINADGSESDVPAIQGTIKVLTHQPLNQTELIRLEMIFNQGETDPNQKNLILEINQVTEGLEFEEYEDAFRVSGYTGSATILNIPENTHPDLSAENTLIPNINGWKSVVAIAPLALNNKTEITQVIIPRTIKEIGQQAFSGMTNLGVVYIPDTVETMGLEVFKNTPNAIILCEAPSKPEGWHNYWYAEQALTILWGVPSANSTFNFNSNGGSLVNKVINNVLFEAPTPPTFLGKHFVKWQYNGQDVTFPFVPEVSGDYTFTAVWEPWIYTVNYMIPTSDTDDTLKLHATQQVTFGDSLGTFFTENTTGSNIPVVNGLQFYSKWKLEDGTSATSSYIPNQDVNTDGYIVELYAQFLDTRGLTFTYNTTDDVYDITGFSLTDTSMADGSINLFIPATFDNGTNGEKYVRNVNFNGSTKNKVGSVTIEENALTNRIISNSSFSYCSYLTEIVIPYGFTSIGEFAFRSCTRLTSINIPYGVTTISSYAFNQCSSLTSVTIPESVTGIGDSAFSGCTRLVSVTIPESVKNIGPRAFSGCTSLTSINIPESVKSIGDSAFSNCSALTSVTIPEGVTIISKNAFYGSSLTSVTLLRNDLLSTMFNNSQFNKTQAVFNITSTQNAISLTSDNMGVMNLAQTTLIAYPSASGDFDWNSTIPASVKNIGQQAFSGCTSLTSINIPYGVTSIGDSAFSNCSALTSVTIPEGVTSIRDSAFSGCTRLVSVTIPESVKNIGKEAFSGCTRLVSVTIPESVTGIGDGAFSNCSALTSVDIPEGVTSIGSSTFYQCSSLTSITISEGVKSIGNYAFQSCTALTSITIPAGVTSIGSSTFRYCSSLTSVHLLRTTPPSLAHTNAFNSNKSGRTFYIPENTYPAYSTATNWSTYASVMEEVI